MSKLDELIKELCPNGVEYNQLKNVSEMKRGTSVTKKNTLRGTIPVISGGREPAYYCDVHNREGETITVAGSGAGAGYVQYWDKPIFVCDAFSIKGNSDVLTKYLYYVLSNNQEYIYSTKKGGGVPHVHISSIENMKIPVPPLKVQQEIVHILDQFMLLIKELVEELTEELATREKQYEYYCKLLLAFDESVPRIALGEVCELSSGGDVPKEHWSQQKTEEFNIPIYSNGVDNKGLYGYTDVARIEKPSVTIAGRGAGVGNTILRRTPYYPIIRLVSAVPKENVDVDYLYHSVRMIEFKIPQGGIPQLTVPMVSRYKIPIPQLDVQKRVAMILNQFENFISGMSEAILFEIEDRQKQYEYYRNELLSFEERVN